jgi:hydroxypyruvate isomerase
MPTFAANLTMLYPDSPFLERFDRARAAGFRFVEFVFPYEHDLTALAAALDRNSLTQVLFNLPSGDWNAGERGLAAYPDRIDEFRRAVATGIEAARALHCRQLNCLAGRRDPRFPLEDQRHVLIENLRYAGRCLADHGLTLLVEMLNPYDVPNYLAPTSQAAFALQDEAGVPNLKIQYDVYHAQRGEGELAATFQKHLARIGHVQIADNPGRHQPGTGEINYRFLFDWMDRVGYTGYIGLEYFPLGTTEESLAWLGDYGYSL